MPKPSHRLPQTMKRQAAQQPKRGCQDHGQSALGQSCPDQSRQQRGHQESHGQKLRKLDHRQRAEDQQNHRTKRQFPQSQAHIGKHGPGKYHQRDAGHLIPEQHIRQQDQTQQTQQPGRHSAGCVTRPGHRGHRLWPVKPAAIGGNGFWHARHGKGFLHSVPPWMGSSSHRLQHLHGTGRAEDVQASWAQNRPRRRYLVVARYRIRQASGIRTITRVSGKENWGIIAALKT